MSDPPDPPESSIFTANSVNTAEHLAGDGETDDAPEFERLVEDIAANGGGDIFVTRPDDCYRFATPVAPETTGNSVRLVGVGNPTIDVSDIDLSGGGNKIDFRGASNVTVERLRIVGGHGEGMQFSMAAGDGFRFSHLTFDTGQGGLNVDGLETGGIRDVHGQYLTAENHHDTDHGWASGLHISEARDVKISHIDIENCDRGIECDDGPRDIALTHGYVADIDHRQASNAVHYTFALDVHVHPDHPHVDNVLFEDFVIEDSIVGFSARAIDHNDQISNVTFRHIKQVDTPAPELEAAVTAEHVDLYADEWTPERACRIHGGSVKLRNWTVHYEPREELIRFDSTLPEPDEITTEHRRHELENIRCLAAGDRLENGISVAPGTEMNHLTVRDARIDGTCTEHGLVIGADGVNQGRYGVEIFDSYLSAEGNVIDVADSNAPLRVVRGSFDGDPPRVPAGSTFEGADGLDVSDGYPGHGTR